MEAFADDFVDAAVSQERMTEAFARQFPGTTVTVTGQHGQVRVVSTDRVEAGA